MYQRLTIVGHLGQDPEMRYMASGDAVTNFSVAVNNNYTNKNGEKITETVWFRVNAWRKLAENCNQYLSRGKKVMVEGTLNFDKQTGSPKTFQRNDGSVGASFEVTASNVLFLSSLGESEEREPDEEPFGGNDPADDFVL
jgi:single-strand DNA-binding protein